jgi:hypothetical protein
MKRQDLENNRIFLCEEPAHEGALPRHIETLRSGLLDFSWITVDGLDDDNERHRIMMGRDQLESSKLHGADREPLKHHNTIREKAVSLKNGRHKEAEWQSFFTKKFFDPLEEMTAMKDEDTRQ